MSTSQSSHNLTTKGLTNKGHTAAEKLLQDASTKNKVELPPTGTASNKKPWSHLLKLQWQLDELQNLPTQEAKRRSTKDEDIVKDISKRIKDMAAQLAEYKKNDPNDKEKQQIVTATNVEIMQQKKLLQHFQEVISSRNTDIKTLKADLSTAKAHNQLLLQEREDTQPLVDVGIAVRRRFLEQHKKKLWAQEEPPIEVSVNDEYIRQGNKAADDANYLADHAFMLQDPSNFETSERKLNIFSLMYYGSDFRESPPRPSTIRGLELIANMWKLERPECNISRFEDIRRNFDQWEMEFFIEREFYMPDLANGEEWSDDPRPTPRLFEALGEMDKLYAEARLLSRDAD